MYTVLPSVTILSYMWMSPKIQFLRDPMISFGILDEKWMGELFLLPKEKSWGNHMIRFGHFYDIHYPFAIIRHRSIISLTIVYFCGDLPILGGLIPVLHIHHLQGTLELEV